MWLRNHWPRVRSKQKQEKEKKEQKNFQNIRCSTMEHSEGHWEQVENDGAPQRHHQDQDITPNSILRKSSKRPTSSLEELQEALVTLSTRQPSPVSFTSGLRSTEATQKLFLMENKPPRSSLSTVSCRRSDLQKFFPSLERVGQFYNPHVLSAFIPPDSAASQREAYFW